MERIGWTQYYMNLTEVIAMRSTCLRRQVGAIIVRDKRILTTGYNGAPRGLRHCLDMGCLRDELGIESGTSQEICRAIHAEQNAIIQGALFGILLDKSTMFCILKPCIICAKMIIASGIIEVVYKEDYPDTMTNDLFSEAGIELRQI